MTALYRVTMTYNLAAGAEKAVNAFWFLDDGTSTQGSAANRVDACSGALWTALKAQLPTSTTMSRIRIDTVNVTTGRTISGQDCALPGGGGGQADGNVPLQCTPVVTLRSATSGRSGRGRIYAPSPALALYFGNQGRIATATRDAYVAAYVAFATAMKAAGVPLTLVVYSRKLQGVLPVTTIEMDDLADTQRSRRRSLTGARKVTGV